MEFEKVRDIIVETLGCDAEAVTPTASLADDLGADSLAAVELVMALEEAVGISIAEEDAVSYTHLDVYKRQIHQRADGQQQVTHEEVLAVQHVLAQNRMEIAPDIVTEHAGQAQEGQQHAVDEHGLLAADAEGVHADGQNVLKHRQHRGEAGNTMNRKNSVPQKRPPDMFTNRGGRV